MRYLLVILLILFSGEQVWAQRTGPGLFMGPGMCSDVSGQVTQQTYCLDYSSGGLLVWNGSQWVPISGNVTQSLNTAVGMTVTNINAGTNAQAAYFASNGTSTAGMSITGTGSAFPNPPYPPDEAYFQSSGSNGLLIYANNGSGVIKFATNQNGGVGTLNLNEDGSGNFAFNPTVAGAVIQLNNGNTSGAVQVFGNFSVSGTVTSALTLSSSLTVNGTTLLNNGLTVNGGSTAISSPLSLNGSTTVQGTMTLEAPLIIDHNNHFTSHLGGGLSPAIAAGCGGSGSIIAGSTDFAGGVNIAGGSSSSCTINFGTPYSGTAFCVCSVHGISGGGLEPCSANIASASQMVLVFGAITGTYVTWICPNT